MERQTKMYSIPQAVSDVITNRRCAGQHVQLDTSADKIMEIWKLIVKRVRAFYNNKPCSIFNTFRMQKANNNSNNNLLKQEPE
jgi:hypothetical protein